MQKSFRGVVVIVYEQKDGVEIETENGKFVYHIPSDGVLKVQLPPSYKVESEEYFIDVEGKKIKLFSSSSQSNKGESTGNTVQKEIDSKVFIYDQEMGMEMVDKTKVVFKTFIISTPDEIQAFRKQKGRIITKAVGGIDIGI
jgi:hypothetical protein